MDKKQQIINLSNTINPATGKVYTTREIATEVGVSQPYVMYARDPENYLRKRRRQSLIQVIEQKFETVASEDWGAAYELVKRLQAKLKGSSNV